MRRKVKARRAMSTVPQVKGQLPGPKAHKDTTCSYCTARSSVNGEADETQSLQGTRLGCTGFLVRGLGSKSLNPKP